MRGRRHDLGTDPAASSPLRVLAAHLLMALSGLTAVTGVAALREGERLPPSPAVAGTVVSAAADEAPSARGRPAPPDPLAAYRGLGAWVDLFDYGHPDSLPPITVVDELAARGVRTLFLQTSRWTHAGDLTRPAEADAFLEAAHARGVGVVGWYLPGFADVERDVRASLAVLAHRTPSGEGFDGFAADIEDDRAVDGDRGRFDAGIAEYARRLREAAPGAVLGAIVPDAKNNERASSRWAGFPWPEIAARFDVVLPMAYWSVTKAASCPGYDAAAYIREVAGKTRALMVEARPLHLIGGIADCIQPDEVPAYVDAAREAGSIGGSLYDFLTTKGHPQADALWEQLVRFNS